MKTVVTAGLSMRVRRGTIYALLGPSGCGKTTLLSCILGRKSLQSGRIAVFGGCPGDRSIGLPGGLVGFMPQDICLYTEFTIQETFQYFGRLQRLSKDTMEKKQVTLGIGLTKCCLLYSFIRVSTWCCVADLAARSA